MATTGIVNGSLFGVYIGTSLIAYGTGCKLSIKHTPIDSSNKDSGAFASKNPGRIEWTVSGSGKFVFGTAGVQPLTSAILARTLCSISFKTNVSGDPTYSGSAYVDSFEADAPDMADSTYSFSFTGSGTLTAS